MHISKSIIVNVGEDVIKGFIRSKGISSQKLINGQDLQSLISDLIDDNDLDIDDLKDFLFRELMFGKRRYIRVFNLEKCRNLIYYEDWYGTLNKKYRIPSLEFNKILSTTVSIDDPKKIVAIHTKYNEKKEIKKISILFMCYIAIKEKGNSCCYIPVDFDLENKLIIIKSWRRKGILDNDNYKPKKIMDDIIEWFDKNFKYSKKYMNEKYKETLYNMNKGLVNELFDKIPAYKDTYKLKEDIEEFSYSILKKMSLENKKKLENGEIYLPSGIMDIKDELLKLLQRITVSDYFFNRDHNEVWDMNVSAIVNSVKFSDKNDVLAIVSGEEKRKPVFCSNSFLVLLKSIEESKKVDTIWISLKYDNKTIRINYDASAEDHYLEIGILSRQKNFTQIEFEYIWEVLKQYESGYNPQIKKMDRAAIS